MKKKQKPIDLEPKMVRAATYIDKSMLEWIKKAALEDFTSESHIIRTLIADGIKARQP